jgi:hypothetical protein
MDEGLNELKKEVFYGLLNLAGRVFILVEHTDGVVIGTRGFLAEEKDKGIVLVFNSKMNFQWGDSGLSAKLAFGKTPQQCFIPPDAIISIFSPEMSAQFSVSPGNGESRRTAEAGPDERPASDRKIVRVDFKKKK